MQQRPARPCQLSLQNRVGFRRSAVTAWPPEGLTVAWWRPPQTRLTAATAALCETARQYWSDFTSCRNADERT